MRAIASLNNLKDYRVIDTAGEPLGRFEDVMLDSSLQHARYFVLAARGGLLSPGTRARYAITSKAVSLDTENEAFVVDLGPAGLDHAEPFPERHDEAREVVYRLD